MTAAKALCGVLLVRRDAGTLLPGEYTRFGSRALVACVGCGGVSTLENEIADDGTVVGIVACPAQSCAVVVYAECEGWNG